MLTNKTIFLFYLLWFSLSCNNPSTKKKNLNWAGTYFADLGLSDTLYLELSNNDSLTIYVKEKGIELEKDKGTWIYRKDLNIIQLNFNRAFIIRKNSTITNLATGEFIVMEKDKSKILVVTNKHSTPKPIKFYLHKISPK